MDIKILEELSEKVIYSTNSIWRSSQQFLDDYVLMQEMLGEIESKDNFRTL